MARPEEDLDADKARCVLFPYSSYPFSTYTAPEDVDLGLYLIRQIINCKGYRSEKCLETNRILVESKWMHAIDYFLALHHTNFKNEMSCMDIEVVVIDEPIIAFTGNCVCTGVSTPRIAWILTG